MQMCFVHLKRFEPMERRKMSGEGRRGMMRCCLVLPAGVSCSGRIVNERESGDREIDGFQQLAVHIDLQRVLPCRARIRDRAGMAALMPHLVPGELRRGIAHWLAVGIANDIKQGDLVVGVLLARQLQAQSDVLIR